MRKQFYGFLTRWALNTLGIWVAVRLLGQTNFSSDQLFHGLWIYLFAGLIFSCINSIIKPVLVIMSLPFILLTLGLFTIIVNGVLVYLSLLLAPGLSMTFGHSILAGIILSLVNYIVSSALEIRYQTRKQKEQS